MTRDDLIAFEKRIADLYVQGKIKAPVHLRSGREQALINIFEQEEIKTDDYIFAYWDSHEICLLKGVLSEEVEAAILDGRSISLCFPKHRVICSGIAGSLMGVAVGLAWAFKKQKSRNRVFLFCGDMSSEMGSFHEAVKYAHNFALPLKFIISDNSLSVMTCTREAWGSENPWFLIPGLESCVISEYAGQIIFFRYENGYPHSGIGRKVEF